MSIQAIRWDALHDYLPEEDYIFWQIQKVGISSPGVMVRTFLHCSSSSYPFVIVRLRNASLVHTSEGTFCSYGHNLLINLLCFNQTW